jgi:hypothetical protein
MNCFKANIAEPKLMKDPFPESEAGRDRKQWGQETMMTFYFSCFPSRPWGRRDDSNPSFSAVCEAQSFVPNGVPLRML